jgi:RNA polymerase sigma factor (sigma-70 family)
MKLTGSGGAPRELDAGRRGVRPSPAMIDAGVIEGFRAGDPDAVRAVYRSYGPTVFAVANRMLSDRSLAEEVTQQTFVQAWKAASRFEAGRELGPWLNTIARRVAIDVYRRESKHATAPLEAVAPDHPAIVTLPPGVDQASDAWEVRQALAELPPDEREVVRLQHLEGHTHTEIAERLGVPVGTVKSRSHRAHQRLAARLAHLRDDTG